MTQAGVPLAQRPWDFIVLARIDGGWFDGGWFFDRGWIGCGWIDRGWIFLRLWPDPPAELAAVRSPWSKL